MAKTNPETGELIYVEAPMDHPIRNRQSVHIEVSAESFIADGQDSVTLTLQFQDGNADPILGERLAKLSVNEQIVQVQLDANGFAQIPLTTTTPRDIVIQAIEPSTGMAFVTAREDVPADPEPPVVTSLSL